MLVFPNVIDNHEAALTLEFLRNAEHGIVESCKLRALAGQCGMNLGEFRDGGWLRAESRPKNAAVTSYKDVLVVTYIQCERRFAEASRPVKDHLFAARIFVPAIENSIDDPARLRWTPHEIRWKARGQEWQPGGLAGALENGHESPPVPFEIENLDLLHPTRATWQATPSIPTQWMGTGTWA
jgi:hypothetical protein